MTPGARPLGIDAHPHRFDVIDARPSLVRRTRCNFTGLAVAVIFFCLSLTPSLLPRSWTLQGTVSGVLTATGYGIGVLVSLMARHVVLREPSIRTKRLAWDILASGGTLLVVLFLYLGWGWQRDIRRLMGAPQPTRYHSVLILLVTVGMSIALLGVGRLLSRATAWLAGRLGRWIPARVAPLLGGIVVGLVFLGFLHGVVYDSLVALANRGFKVVNAETSPAVGPPTRPERSGGPGSLVSWASLGNKGRDFIAGGPTTVELEAFSGEPARQPIRVYVGLESAPTVETEAALALKELERAGAFGRRVLCVVTATGTGWIDANGIDALEYMYEGDSALVSIQYSYLPSWISFLVDRSRAEQAGRELFNEVYARWSQLPEARRPRLLVFGESLGSFGGEAAFSGTDDLRNRTDGALWEGPPNDNTLWGEFVRKRDPETTEILPCTSGA
jgi:uncharacterized membrane protein